MLEQDVVAEISLIGRHESRARPGQRRVEPLHPAFAADGHAGPHEVVAVERQHDVDFGADLERSFDEIRSAPHAADV